MINRRVFDSAPFKRRSKSRTIQNSRGWSGHAAAESLPIMKRILSEVLRQKDGVVGRNGRAGALRIEFIERSRNQSLGIEWVFATDRAEWST